MRKHSSFSFLLVFIAVFCVFLGTAFAEEITITDVLGREVTINVPPELAVVAGKKTGTISEVPFMFKHASGHIGAFKGGQDKGKFMALIENDAPAMEDSSVEAIAAMKPDLIFLKSYTREDAGMAFEETGIPVVYLSLETFDDYQVDIMNVGKVMEEEERASEILAYYDEIVARVAEKTKDLAEKKRVLLLQYAETDGAYTLKVAPVSWLQTQIVELAGGEPVGTEVGMNANSWIDVNFEQIAAWDPDVVLVVNYFADPKASVQKLLGEPGWAQLRAAKEEQVFPFGKDTLSWDSASPRWGLGLLWTLKTVYPELGEDIDLDQEMLKFYRWFGLSDEVIEENLIAAYHAEPALVP